MHNDQQQAHREVARQVDDMLARSASYHGLSPEQRSQIRSDTINVVETMASNNQAQALRRPEDPVDPYAVPMEGIGSIPGVGSPPLNPNQNKQQPTFTGGAQPNADRSILPTKGITDTFGSAVTTGVTATGEMVRQVNFPAFVAELIQGVFQAVVDASIDQMRAYGELVQSVTMSLADFRDANVSENQARDHLVSKAPNLFQVNIGDTGPTVGMRPDADDENLPDFQEMFGMKDPVGFLDDETIEQKLVPAARDDLARSRQALLATTLLMGINRIIVTNGRINARMNFQFTSRDIGSTQNTAYDYENQGNITTQQRDYESSSETGEDYRRGSRYSRNQGWRSHQSGESSRWSKQSNQSVTAPMVTLTNVEQSQSQAELEAKGQLAGTVDLNFKSDTVDLNKLVSEADIFKLEGIRNSGRGAVAPDAENTQKDKVAET